MTGPLLAAAIALPAACLITAASYGTDRGWPWLLTSGAALALLTGAGLGVVLVLLGLTPA